jgi:hypothetical protein
VQRSKEAGEGPGGSRFAHPAEAAGTPKTWPRRAFAHGTRVTHHFEISKNF